MMRLAVVCGGPSAERGISLNSARSVMDHLTPLGCDIIPIYCDPNKRFYRLSPSQLYSNTPSDFDFKLKHTASPLTETQLIEECRSVDLVFPTMHGAYGEDGDWQELMERNKIRFVGSPSKTCRMMFDKARANSHMAEHGFATLPHCLITTDDNDDARIQKIKDFFIKHAITKAVVKPSAGGSSLGVATVTTPFDALSKIETIFQQHFDTQALVEPYCEGVEFTVLVLENNNNEPVSLIPTEITLSGGDIFSFRHKYLPTCHVEYHCPPRFENEVILRIQKSAEVLFKFFGMRDFARLDGWLLHDGRVIFSDFNPISGMEQNSFLFIQGSRIGLKHTDILQMIVARAAHRYGLPPLQRTETHYRGKIEKVSVLFGGATAERQVSLMSGTNVWLKLMADPAFHCEPYLLSPTNEVWHLPYTYTLNHTVEEILARCLEADSITTRLKVLVPPLRQRLGLQPLPANADLIPHAVSLEEFCLNSKKDNAFVFIALHGGDGENGTLQALLDKHDIAYNGSGSKASHLCMDKNETGNVIRALNDPNLISAPKVLVSIKDTRVLHEVWQSAQQTLNSTDILIKPQADGCSAGVVRLSSESELGLYIKALQDKITVLLPGTLKHLHQSLELPSHADALLLEPFIVTDDIRVENLELKYNRRMGWIELTVGVLEENGHYHALTPSITVAQGEVLSLEEKFQGGTGVNLTPPPETIVNKHQLKTIQEMIEKAAKALHIEGYARLDIFFNVESNQTMLIEANSLPGLTASTVIFHQALAEQPPLIPREFLSKLVRLGQMKQQIYSKHLQHRH